MKWNITRIRNLDNCYHYVMTIPYTMTFWWCKHFVWTREPNFFVNISSSCLKISLHTEFHHHRLPGSKLLVLGFTLFWGGWGDPTFIFDISSSWVEISLHTEFQLSRLPGSKTASFMLNPILRGGRGVITICFLIFLIVGLK